MDMQRGGFAESEEEEAALAEEFAGAVALNSNQGSSAATSALPIRTDAADCAFYLRTGSCKFGLNCLFNHPMKIPSQAVKDNHQEISHQIVCKYYLAAGVCKYGESCRYIHSKGESELQSNFLGLPIRLGEKECPFYMHNGTCRYGARCVFHHPEPTSMGGLNSSYSILNDESVGQSNCSLGNNSRSESLPLHFSGTSQLDLTSWPSKASHLSSDKTVSFPSHSSSHISSHSERRDYLGPSYLYQRSGISRSTQESNASMKSIESFKQANTVQPEEFPERPGQPECTYFMKTGYCKFKFQCRFHHPKGYLHQRSGLPQSIQESNIESFDQANPVQPEGFPERPDQPECTFFMKTGDCKFKFQCRFHHPKGYLHQRSGLSLSIQESYIESFEHANAVQPEEFPERPGQPECTYFMKTGNCKFKFQCRFHHPKGWAQKSDRMFNDKGLPLRPGDTICRHYERFGICKYGSSCLFDHPVDHVSLISPTWSNANHASRLNLGG